MKAHSFITVLTASMLLMQTVAQAEPLLFKTIAGQGMAGANDGSVVEASFAAPSAIAVDPVGNIYVADAQSGTIRLITSNLVSTVAGSPGAAGIADGLGGNARFGFPQGLALGPQGVLYVADTGNATVRKVAQGQVSTWVGVPGEFNRYDGTGTNANFFHPQGIAVDASGIVYVADSWNHTIRRIFPDGHVVTVAGLAGSSGSADGTNAKARFHRPGGVGLDPGGNLFVADSLNHTVRRVTPGGVVTTVAGLAGVYGSADGTNSGARFFQPEGIALDANGTIFVADTGNHSIRKITAVGSNWVVSTVGGLPEESGFVDGTGSHERFHFPSGLALHRGYLLVADAGNHAIRAETFALQSGPESPGFVHYSFTGKSNLLYTVERSVDLANWTSVTNVSSSTGHLQFSDSKSPAEPRFYRARVAP